MTGSDRGPRRRNCAPERQNTSPFLFFFILGTRERGFITQKDVTNNAEFIHATIRPISIDEDRVFARVKSVQPGRVDELLLRPLQINRRLGVAGLSGFEVLQKIHRSGG